MNLEGHKLSDHSSLQAHLPYYNTFLVYFMVTFLI